jgi:hypothetical protein
MCELTDALLRLHRRCEESVTLTLNMQTSLNEYEQTLHELAQLLEGRENAITPE